MKASTLNWIIFPFLVVIFSCQAKNPNGFDLLDKTEEPLNIKTQTNLSSDSLILAAISEALHMEYQPNSVERYVPESIADGSFQTYDSIIPGYRFKFVSEAHANEIIEAFFEKTKATGNYLYLTNLDFDDSFDTYYDIVIAPVANQIELIRFVGIEAWNYDMSNEDIVQWFEQKQTEFDFEIFVADYDRIETRITSEPNSYRKLAKEIYEFCPDVIDQGHEDMNELIQYLQESKHMWFWWD